MRTECHEMLAAQDRRARARHLGAGVFATLLAVLALAALAGTASAHVGRTAAGITTSTESTTSAPPTTPDTTTAPTEPSTTEDTTTESTTTETTPAVTTHDRADNHHDSSRTEPGRRRSRRGRGGDLHRRFGHSVGLDRLRHPCCGGDRLRDRLARTALATHFIGLGPLLRAGSVRLRRHVDCGDTYAATATYSR